MAESTPLEDIEIGKTSSQCRYFKMKTLNSHEKSTTNDLIVEYIHEKAIIFSDQSTSYNDFANLVEMHITEKSSEETTKTTLRWVHITSSNAKRNLLGVYHMIKEDTCKLTSMNFAISSTEDTLVNDSLTD